MHSVKGNVSMHAWDQGIVYTDMSAAARVLQAPASGSQVSFVPVQLMGKLPVHLAPRLPQHRGC